MMQLLQDIYRHRDLLYILVQRNIKIRYKSSLLGFFWTLLSPLLLIVIYSIFLGILRIPIHLPMLVIGIIAWQFLAMCLGDSLHAIIGNANLIKKSAFPRIILPMAMTLANLINLVLSMAVVCGYLLVVKAPFGPFYWLPVIILTEYALCLGVSLLVASLNVYFRDIEHILSIGLTAWFFLTPVIYEISLVTEKFGHVIRWAFFANPMTGLVTAYRAVLVSESIPSVGLLALSFALAWIVPLVGIAVFQKLQVKFADVL